MTHLLLYLCLTLTATAPPQTLTASQQPTSTEVQTNPRTESLWRLHFPRYAQSCLRFEDGTVCLPTYDVHYPSSTALTVAQAGRKLAAALKKTKKLAAFYRLLRADDAEIEVLATTLRDLAVGEYGHVAAVRIDEILSVDQMVVRGLRLIDDATLRADITAEKSRLKEKKLTKKQIDAGIEWKFRHRLAASDRQKSRKYRDRIRLVGFSTEGLRRRQVWRGEDDKGVSLAIVKLENIDPDDDKQRWVAIPTTDIVQVIGLDESGFEQHIQSLGLDRASFVQFVQQMHRTYRDEAPQHVFKRLLVIDEKKSKD